ncbi:hypothetical protein CR513_49475, partial [Mucuna pruriens]
MEASSNKEEEAQPAKSSLITPFLSYAYMGSHSQEGENEKNEKLHEAFGELQEEVRRYFWGEKSEEKRMEGPSVDWGSLSPKSKFMMSYIRELGMNLNKVGKGLDLVYKVVVRLVTVKFGDYALVWWTQVLEDIKRGEKDSCEDWVALKRLMRNMDLDNKFQRLYQGSRSVEEYHKKMKMDLMRVKIRENE